MKRFDFDAAHHLDFLPADHKCRRMHGHTYVVEAEFRGNPDLNGMLVDYGEIAKVGEKLDHRCLNEIPGLEFPTTEVLVEWIVKELVLAMPPHVTVVRVRVHESSTTWAEWRLP